MIPGYLKTLRQSKRTGGESLQGTPLNALNALNAHPRLERLAAEEGVIECEKADSVGRSAASSQTSTCAKSAISAKSPSPYQSEFDALERRCPVVTLASPAQLTIGKSGFSIRPNCLCR